MKIFQVLRYQKPYHLFPIKNYITNKHWLHSFNLIAKVGITNQYIKDLGKVLDIQFYHNIDDVVLENKKLFKIVGVNKSVDYLSPYTCKISEINEDIRNLENLISLNNNPECDINNWIMKITK